MFDNPGGKIKIVAWIIFFLSIVATLIVLALKIIPLMLEGRVDVLSFLFYLFSSLLGGIIGGFFIALLIYWFGELIESQSNTEELVASLALQTSKQKADN